MEHCIALLSISSCIFKISVLKYFSNDLMFYHCTWVFFDFFINSLFCFLWVISLTACWYDFNSKQLPFEKFLQNPFLGCLWSPWTGKIIWSAIEAFYLMIWAKFRWRIHQSYRKLLWENQFLKILCSGFYGRSNYFACPGTP